MNNKHQFDFSAEELHPDPREFGQCWKCGKMFPEEELSKPDDVSYYATCLGCYEVLKENSQK